MAAVMEVVARVKEVVDLGTVVGARGAVAKASAVVEKALVV